MRELARAALAMAEGARGDALARSFGAKEGAAR
jgi:hypothetical protein